MVKPKPKLKRISLISTLVVAVAAMAGVVFANPSNSGRTETAQTTKASVTSTEQEKPVKPAEKTPEKTEPAVAPTPTPVATPEPTPAPVDPNGCEAKGMWWRADNYECIPKAIPSAAAPAPAASQPAPVRVASTSGVEQWRGLTAQYFGAETDYALRIMQCESGGNTAAHSPTDDYGLMQVNSVHAGKVGGNLSALFDPATNLQIAKQIRDGSGWSAWSCSRKI